MEIEKNLDLQEEAAKVASECHLYSGKPDAMEHDKTVIDWFCKNGELRAYHRDNVHVLSLVSQNRLIFNLGPIWRIEHEDLINTSSINKIVQMRAELIKYAWSKFSKVIYCTNNLYFTPEETLDRFRGDESCVFSNSRENAKSIVKHKKQLIELLDLL